MKKWDLTTEEAQLLKVLKHQDGQMKNLDNRFNSLLTDSPEIKRAEELIKSLRVALPTARSQRAVKGKRPLLTGMRTYEEIVRDAEENVLESVSFEDILSPNEIRAVEEQLKNWRFEFNRLNSLDSLDWCISGISGLLAAMVDVFLIQMPKHPGFLGGQGSEGGPLSNWIRDKVNASISPDKVKEMEKEFWVTYDPSTSEKLSVKIEGLGPGTHRFQSLGHDPILGFIFGVKDIFCGTFTAISKDGKLISQQVCSPEMGLSLFEAVSRVFGHLLSDVTTQRGLPIPLMPLLEFLQVGSFGKKDYPIGEVARAMYRSGYDFRHFLSMSVSPMLIEVIVRLLYGIKRRYEGNDWIDCVPLDIVGHRKPKLQTMLFVSHLIATAANAGKVYFTGNPLSINYTQWMLFSKYALSQLKWELINKENDRQAYVQKQIDNDWNMLSDNLTTTWNEVMCQPMTLKC